MKSPLKIIPAAALALMLLAGCGSGPTDTVKALAAGTDAAAVETTAADTTAQSAELNSTISKRDSSGDYDAAQAVTLSPEDELTITQAGVYLLSGSYENKMIVVEVDKTEKVQLVLDNAALSNDSGPAIYVRSADKVFLTAAEGTVNTIRDGAAYTLSDGETTLDAAVFSKEDLTINGAGRLTIEGNCKHAVVSKDELVVTAKDLTVSAVSTGLDGKDSVALSGATVTISAGSNGLRAQNAEEAGRGFVYVADSTVTVVSGTDGIQAATELVAENAEITVTAGGGSTARSTDTTASYKGLKAGTTLTIDGGSYTLDTLDDAIHSNGSLSILDGVFSIRSGDDGVHANDTAEISGGTLDITAYEGIEATTVRISGGELTIGATDDGVNASWKSTGSTPLVEISGGSVSITVGPGDTDGIDSNGDILISGGTVSVNGQSAFDYDGSASLSGGALYVNGQQLTSIPNQMMGGFGGMGGMNGRGGMVRPDGFGQPELPEAFNGSTPPERPAEFGGRGRQRS